MVNGLFSSRTKQTEGTFECCLPSSVRTSWQTNRCESNLVWDLLLRFSSTRDKTSCWFECFYALLITPSAAVWMCVFFFSVIIRIWVQHRFKIIKRCCFLLLIIAGCVRRQMSWRREPKNGQLNHPKKTTLLCPAQCYAAPWLLLEICIYLQRFRALYNQQPCKHRHQLSHTELNRERERERERERDRERENGDEE